MKHLTGHLADAPDLLEVVVQDNLKFDAEEFHPPQHPKFRVSSTTESKFVFVVFSLCIPKQINLTRNDKPELYTFFLSKLKKENFVHLLLFDTSGQSHEHKKERYFAFFPIFIVREGIVSLFFYIKAIELRFGQRR